MVRYARRIWNSPAKYHSTRTNRHHLTMRLNNVYSVGEYFFIDFSVENRTNLRFDIDELRFKLSDKKQQKATNVQDLMLEPVLLLEKSTSFQHGYRNVVVLKKMTFPNDKVLSIELSEHQISGRTISMTVDYEDVLSADAFDSSLLVED
jgi:conjugative transposon TraN protein